jgi:predicted acyl esterase
MHRFLVFVALLVALALPAAAGAYVPKDADWTEQYISTPDGDVLHADVLRPKGDTLDAAHKTPVIMTISPYTNHSNQAGTDFDPSASGPSSRWQDFEDGADPFAHGYTYVIVDLPGFGGSSGCTDWGGPEEQAAVKNAIQWAAAQPWSTGSVATYGKSYDGWTGLMALAQQPKGLAAVVSQEPVYSGYEYEYMNGVRMSTSAEEGPLFDAINATPGTTSDTPQYQTNTLPITPWCYGTNAALQQQDDPASGFWSVRDLIPAVRGVKTPLLMTQGFLEDNTKPQDAFKFFNNLAGPKRAWFGQWNHVRGNETCLASGDADSYCNARNAGQLKMGRKGWFDEVISFYDQYLKGQAPTTSYPPIAVEGGDGKWRAETSWPPADSHIYETTLKPGTYTDDGNNNGTGSGAGTGIWTISDPLPYDVHFAGVPHVTVDAQTTVPNANLVVDVYDIDGAGKATLISRGAQLVRTAGLQSFDLYGEDWPIPAGHRLGVLITGSNAEWWTHVPTQQTVTVAAARIGLPFLSVRRTSDQPGTPSLKLLAYKGSAPFGVAAATIASATAPFTLPDPLEPAG